MGDRRFRPGHRSNAQLRGTGKMSEDRFAWLKTAVGQFVILKKKEEEDTETGPTIRLFLPRPGARPVSYNLTALTAEELKLTREFFNLLFDQAEPVCELRDKVAQDALANGDDSFARVYREIPQFIVRERAQRGHRQGVLNRPEDDAAGSGGDGDLSGGIRGDGGTLADGEPEASSSQDHGQEADQP